RSGGGSSDSSRRRTAPGPYGSAGFSRGSSSGGASRGSGSSDTGLSSARRIDPSSWGGRQEPEFAAEDESQDVPALRVGERVQHAKFGSGTIAEFSGSGRDAKVRIDFDDEE